MTYRVWAEYIKDATPKRGQYRVVDYYENHFDLGITVCSSSDLGIKRACDAILCFTAHRRPRVGTYINPRRELGI